LTVNEVTFSLYWNPEIHVLQATVLKKPWNTPCAPIVSYLLSSVEQTSMAPLIMEHDN